MLPERMKPSFPKKMGASAALGIGIAAGFAFLIALGAGLGLLTQEMAVVACFGLVSAAAIALLLGER